MNFPSQIQNKEHPKTHKQITTPWCSTRLYASGSGMSLGFHPAEQAGEGSELFCPPSVLNTPGEPANTERRFMKGVVSLLECEEKMAG